MASNKQRRDMELRESMAKEAEDSIFGDLIDSVPIDPSIAVRDRFAKTVKNHMLLLLMLKTPGFPLEAGEKLYVNVGNPKTLDSMTLLENGTFETTRGIKESLDAAEAAYHPSDRKSTKSNGWTRVYVQTPSFSYVPLGELIVDNFDALGLPIDVVVDKKALANHLIASGYAQEPFSKMIANAAKKTNEKKPKAAKLDSNREEMDGSVQ